MGLIQFSAEIPNLEGHRRGFIEAMKRQVYLIATAFQRAIQKRKFTAFLNQPGSGRWYRSKSGIGLHQASAQGQPPAPDTRRYRDSWNVDVIQTKDGYATILWSRLWDVFGRRLELGGWGGGVYIAPRPHIRPMIEGADREIQAELQRLNA